MHSSNHPDDNLGSSKSVDCGLNVSINMTDTCKTIGIDILLYVMCISICISYKQAPLSLQNGIELVSKLLTFRFSILRR